MQPPPRKVKESQQVKLVFSEQLSKLQTKQHQDTELLEEIRSFSKHRAAIEKGYGQALQRLAVQYQKRDWQRGNIDAITSGSVFGVWRSMVDAIAQTAESRLAAAEEYCRLTGQVSRSFRNTKDIRAKRGLERLQRVQGEVLDALRELHLIKKTYHRLSHIANIAREKAADAQTRAKKSEHGIFHFKTGLLKMTAKQMDGDVYDDLRNHLLLLCGTELDTCLSTQKLYSKIWDSVAKVTREKNIQQFLRESVSFSKTIEFTFQPAPFDKVCSLQEVYVSEAGSCLVKEAKKWVTKAAKDFKILTHGERAVQMLKSRLKLLSGDTGFSVEHKIAEVQDSVRKAKLSRVKAEARLALLSVRVTGTELWLHDAMSQAEEELERERRLSEQRRSTEDFSEEEFELTDFEDYDDENGEITDPVSASEVCVFPAACRVIYSYQANQSDELSIMEGEELQVCNSCGQMGYVPEHFVQFQCLPAEGDAQLDSSFSSTSSSGNKARAGSRGLAKALYSYQAQSAEELSFQEGALIHLIRYRYGEVDDGFWEGELNGRTGVFPSLVVELVHNEGEKEVKQEEEPLPTPTMPLPPPPIPSSPGCSPPLSATPPSCVDRPRDNTAESEGSSHKSPDLCSSRLRPCRAPPPPPARKPSPQP
ncbi:F-BAR and double SH3 domains protein 1-like isoform X2 [Seriola dumerili]|uniref:F-BAR and double SH3 domains protein 1-like isoform X2 n=1 Tax=Seriola dumerili TaxID=41447 RepID=UPI000BBF39A9|nr:F-BAR and double SH3 domains protein 1-like isoform X2 [Seriola dumerili]